MKFFKSDKNHFFKKCPGNLILHCKQGWPVRVDRLSVSRVRADRFKNLAGPCRVRVQIFKISRARVGSESKISRRVRVGSKFLDNFEFKNDTPTLYKRTGAKKVFRPVFRAKICCPSSFVPMFFLKKIIARRKRPPEIIYGNIKYNNNSFSNSKLSLTKVNKKSCFEFRFSRSDLKVSCSDLDFNFGFGVSE